ncbi:unnamed protein product [Brassica oleracea var. botrytis]|uniref:(rape) hypothetical protein n=1 Tax=Brassica napus TaxID=3708 RepID=A0A078FSQ2_BRANA|nr:unnamed protein product [Brassica napus]CDY17525.1 BnaC03g65380D [Brassica napus]
MSISFHGRSNSVPSMQHPQAAHVDEQLTRLRSSEAASSSSSSSIYQRLSNLQDLHDSLDKMLRLSITNKALSQVQVEKLLDGSLRILDLCNVAKDALSGASYLDLWRSKAEEWMSGWAHGVGSGLGRGNCGPSSSSCLAGLRWCIFGPVNLFLGSLSELLSFPNQFDQRRVLHRRSLCEEVSCRSCQLRLSFSVAARVEAAGVLDDLGLPRLLLAFGCRLLFLSSWCRCDGVWWLIGASSPNKARPFLFRVPWSRV